MAEQQAALGTPIEFVSVPGPDQSNLETGILGSQGQPVAARESQVGAVASNLGSQTQNTQIEGGNAYQPKEPRVARKRKAPLRRTSF